MQEFHELKDEMDVVFKRKGKRYRPTSDTIYTFDIEVSSIYKLDGEWQAFDYNRPQQEYSGIEKCSVPYIWMFGINDKVYYGRHFKDVLTVLKSISDPVVRKVIWVHSLAYEFQFLREIFDDFTIESMVCRDALKPISFVIKEFNIQFRCSYMLTNMSLDQASKEYGTVYKRTGTYDYNKLRGESTKLTKTEMLYCEYDCLSLRSVIEHYLHKWGHIVNIPLTSTSEVRIALRDRLNFWYFRNVTWQLVPDPDMFLRLMGTFAGGYTHSNLINTNIVLHDVTGYDIASSYPFSLCCERYPVKPFKEYNYDRYMQLKERDSYAWFFEIRIHELRPRFYNHYISFSKIYNVDGIIVTDNGRLVSCEDGSFCMWCTDVDLDIIEKTYDIGHIELIQIYGAYKDYIDKRIIRFILDMYKNKTELKGVKEKEALYKQSKAYINSIYGMSVTNALKNSASYGEGDEEYDEDFKEVKWRKLKIDDSDPKQKKRFDKFVESTLEKQKKSYSNLLYYATGLWVTSYSRRNVFMTALKIGNGRGTKFTDDQECYIDTDSIKFLGDHTEIFQEYNRGVIEKYKAVIKHYHEFTLDDFMPRDPDGIKHPIGFFEFDGKYKEAVFLGAKKYAYRDGKGLHITCAGVAKSGVKALNDDIRNFHKGFVFDYHNSGKLTHIYLDNQQPIDFTDYKGKKQHSEMKYGVVLQPTTYTVGITAEYEALFTSIQEELLRHG